MLPPIDPAVLAQNPEFETLYRDLTTTKLNSNGTSRFDSKTQKERDSVVEDLRQARTVEAKRAFLRAGLRNVANGGFELSEELQQSVAVTVALLEREICAEDWEVVEEDVRGFVENVQPIASLLAQNYEGDASLLCQLAALPTATTTTHSKLYPTATPTLQTLPQDLEAIQTTLLNLSQTLYTLRLHLSDSFSPSPQTLRPTQTPKPSPAAVPSLQTPQTHLTTLAIRTLEQNIHGATSRALKAHSTSLALVAEGLNKKLALQERQTEAVLGTEEVRAVLDAEVKELESGLRGLRAEIRESEGRLGALKGVGGLKGVAGEVRGVRREVERVRGEVRRLEGAA